MRKAFFKFIGILLALIIGGFLIIGTIYPYSFASINKSIDYKSLDTISNEYERNVIFLTKQLDSQDIDSSTKHTIRKTLNLLSNPIFTEKSNNKVSKTDLEKFNNEMNLLVNELRKSIRENGKTFSNDEFNSFTTLKSHFEVYHEWLNDYLEQPFVSEKKWNKILNKFHESLLIDLKEMNVFYKNK